MIAVSIVSHNHGQMTVELLRQLRRCPKVTRIVVTFNVPEDTEVVADEIVSVIRNDVSRGFGANHNAAFETCHEPFFCVLNPDIELVGDPFLQLLETMEGGGCSIVAPAVVSPSGDHEDNIRYFPTLRTLMLKAVLGRDGRYPIEIERKPATVDWVAGMFMLFRSEDFARLGGFDVHYFLYYEDVDICARAWRSGMKVMVCPSVSVIHDARRESHRNWRYMRWHLASMFRFLTSGLGSRR